MIESFMPTCSFLSCLEKTVPVGGTRPQNEGAHFAASILSSVCVGRNKRSLNINRTTEI